MKQKEALHTAARRYLMDRAAELEHGVPQDIRDWSPEQKDRMSRAWEYREFLTRVECATPHLSGSIEAGRQWLLAAIREPLFVGKRESSRGRSETFPPSEERLRRRAEEADRLSEYVLGLSEAALLAIDPLPYRRTLSEPEAERIWRELGARWDLTSNYWYPGSQGQPGREMLFLRLGFARRPEVVEGLRRSLYRQAVARVLVIPCGSIDPALEMDPEWFDIPLPTTMDTFCSAATFDWILFESHEPLITLAGDDLVREFKRRVPEWEEGEFRGTREDYMRCD